MNKEKADIIQGCCNRSMCPITNTLDVIGDKWTLLVIRDMMFFGRAQYREFLEAGEGISTNILADRLKKLEEFGVISKKEYQTNPTRYEYHLTDIGNSLRPLLMEMIKWGGAHVEGAYAPTEEDLEKITKKKGS